MVGVSLRTTWFYKPHSAPIPLREIFDYLKSKNVKSIELRSVRPGHDADLVKNAADTVWDSGFNLTVHARVNSLESCVSDVFDNLKSTIENIRQENLVITIHPIDGDNTKMLKMLSDHITENGYPVKIALENNRLLPNGEQGDSTALVAKAVMEAERDNIGICFDMGHLAYFVKKNLEDDPEYTVNKEFLKRVIHTHIHGMNGLTTHYPPSDDDTRISSFMNALAHGYFGVYNIELDFPRIEKLWEPISALDTAIDYVEKNLSQCARLYDRIREDFDNQLIDCVNQVKAPCTGTRLGVLNSSTYLFNTNGFLWCMDPAFKNADHLAKTPKKIGKILEDFKLFIISHAHSDHLEPKTVKRLVNLDALWIIPDFLEEKAEELGIKKEKTVLAKVGEPIQIEDLTIIPFDGAHFRSSGAGLKEFGYFVKTADGPSLAFPVDVRNHSIPRPDFVSEADYCFAHLWLGDNTDLEKCKDHLEPFSRYMLNFSRKNILIGHLYENGRADKYMWRAHHAELASKTISKLSCDTKVTILSHGNVSKL